MAGRGGGRGGASLRGVPPCAAARGRPAPWHALHHTSQPTYLSLHVPALLTISCIYAPSDVYVRGTHWIVIPCISPAVCAASDFDMLVFNFLPHGQLPVQQHQPKLQAGRLEASVRLRRRHHRGDGLPGRHRSAGAQLCAQHCGARATALRRAGSRAGPWVCASAAVVVQRKVAGCKMHVNRIMLHGVRHGSIMDFTGVSLVMMRKR